MNCVKPISSTPYDAVLRVVSYCEGQLEGVLTHPRLKQAKLVRSVPQMLFLLGDLLEQEDAPINPPGTEPLWMTDIQPIETIRIRILYREHYTWQGCILWGQDQKAMPFRSVFEMIRILDEILAE